MYHCVSGPECSQKYTNGRAGGFRKATAPHIRHYIRSPEGRKVSQWMLTRQVSCARVVDTKINVESTRISTTSTSTDSIRSSLADLISITGGTQRGVTQEQSLRRGQWAKLICGASFEVRGVQTRDMRCCCVWYSYD